VWRQLGQPEGTENIEEGEWIGNGVKHDGEFLLGSDD